MVSPDRFRQAFPMAERDDALKGMTQLDYFAAAALSGLVGAVYQAAPGGDRTQDVVEACFNLAEAMVVESEKRHQEYESSR